MKQEDEAARVSNGFHTPPWYTKNDKTAQIPEFPWVSLFWPMLWTKWRGKAWTSTSTTSIWCRRGNMSRLFFCDFADIHTYAHVYIYIYIYALGDIIQMPFPLTMLGQGHGDSAGKKDCKSRGSAMRLPVLHPREAHNCTCCINNLPGVLHCDGFKIFLRVVH